MIRSKLSYCAFVALVTLAGLMLASFVRLHVDEAGQPATVRLGTPIYEGCYINFDAPTPTPLPPGGNAAEGHLALRFRLDGQSHGGFKAIELLLLDCAGAGRGERRDFGWRAVTAIERQATLRHDVELAVASGPLPAGSYDRVFSAVDSAAGVTAEGERVQLHAHVEPIAKGFSLAGGQDITIDIILTVQPRPSFQGGGWNLFVRDAY